MKSASRSPIYSSKSVSFGFVVHSSTGFATRRLSKLQRIHRPRFSHEKQLTLEIKITKGQFESGGIKRYSQWLQNLLHVVGADLKRPSSVLHHLEKQNNSPTRNRQGFRFRNVAKKCVSKLKSLETSFSHPVVVVDPISLHHSFFRNQYLSIIHKSYCLISCSRSKSALKSDRFEMLFSSMQHGTFYPKLPPKFLCDLE